MAGYDGYGMPAVDFSTLGNLGNVYDRAKQGAVRDRTLAELGQGPLDYSQAVPKLLAAGMPQEALSLARLAQAASQQQYNQGRDARDFALRKTEIDRAQSNTDRSFNFQKQQAEEAARGFDLREVDDNGNKVLVRTNKATGVSERVPIAGMPAQPNNPFTTGKMTGDEGKSALFADRAATSHDVISRFEKINNTPTGFIGGVLEKNVPEGAFNLGASADRQQFMNAKRSFVNALLRRESGAAINAGEFASYDKEYFPQPGDSAAVIDQKRKHRAEVIVGLAREGGRSYQPTFSFDPSGNLIRGKPRGGGMLGGLPGFAQGETIMDATPAVEAPPRSGQAGAVKWRLVD